MVLKSVPARLAELPCSVRRGCSESSCVTSQRGSREQDVLLALLCLLFFYVLCQVVAVLHLQFCLDPFLAFSVSERM